MEVKVTELIMSSGTNCPPAMKSTSGSNKTLDLNKSR